MYHSFSVADSILTSSSTNAERLREAVGKVEGQYANTHAPDQFLCNFAVEVFTQKILCSIVLLEV